LDPLFTPDGFKAYVNDLLVRMTNPFLKDAVERVTRDTRRKLGWDDRLIGTMRLALGQGIQPERYVRGAAAAVRLLAVEENSTPAELLDALWKDRDVIQAAQIRQLISSDLVGDRHCLEEKAL
jgi:mannitol-1-phosphate/altronate dehydrogenase